MELKIAKIGTETHTGVNKTESWIAVMKKKMIVTMDIYGGRLFFSSYNDTFCHVKSWDIVLGVSK